MKHLRALLLLATHYSLLATGLALAASPDPQPNPALQSAWTLFLNAQTETDYTAALNAAFAVKSPDARMLIGAFRDVEIAKKFYASADKKHSASLGATTKAEQRKLFGENPFDTPSAYDRFDTADPLIGRYQNPGGTLTLDITAYPYTHYLATLTMNGTSTRLTGSSTDGQTLTLAAPSNKTLTATRNPASNTYTLTHNGTSTTLSRTTIAKTNFAPPPGAIILLSEKTGPKNFVHNYPKNPRPSEWLFLPGGIMQMTEKTGSSYSIAKHNDARIYLEFRHAYNRWATDLRRGNSGLFVFNTYEIQIIDSFIRPATDTSEGSIYHIAVPKIQASAAPLEWQSLEVDFTAPKFDSNGNKIKNARMSVWHNSINIHDDVELPNPTAGSVEGGRALKDPQGPQPIMLQAHGGLVQYRNIWLLNK